MPSDLPIFLVSNMLSIPSSKIFISNIFFNSSSFIWFFLIVSTSFLIMPFFLSPWAYCSSSSFFFLRFYLFIFREREREREAEKRQCVVASCVHPTGDLAHNPGMCPDWELNQWPFGLQTGTQSTEPYQPGPILKFYLLIPFCHFCVISYCLIVLLVMYHILLLHLSSNFFIGSWTLWIFSCWVSGFCCLTLKNVEFCFGNLLSHFLSSFTLLNIVYKLCYDNSRIDFTEGLG